MKNKTADRKSFIFLGFNANKESLNDWTAAFLFSANFLTDDMCAWKSNEQHLPPFFYKRAPLHHMHFQAVFLRSRS